MGRLDRAQGNTGRGRGAADKMAGEEDGSGFVLVIDVKRGFNSGQLCFVSNAPWGQRIPMKEEATWNTNTETAKNNQNEYQHT